ncbi:MAG: alcohol dehydrogenase catalytic domain-containing protein [Candidatus Bathyarchaeota archaeon]|nr:MAG: alcohol dehydrogenase catalytic domain-containing protein [Candidatus Bathyarchaeota archaeon]
MKVAIYYSPEDIRYVDAPVPNIGSEEALVRMKACGICGSDLMKWYIKNRVPLVLGHEPCGIITKIGKNVKEFEVGERVFVHHHVACMTCYHCSRGFFTMCEQFKRTHIEPGGFSEFFKVPSPNLKLDTLRIPESISFEEGTLIEPIACCIRAQNKCNIQQGDSVSIIGAGTSGLIHEMLLNNRGVKQIIVSDLVDFRLDIAKALGANVVINPKKENIEKKVKEFTEDKGANIVIVTAPTLEAITSGIKVCSKGGTICIFAPISPKVHASIDLNKLFFSEIKIVFSYSTSHIETREALKLLHNNQINAKKLITHRFPLHKIGEAFKTALTNKESLKIVIIGE